MLLDDFYTVIEMVDSGGPSGPGPGNQVKKFMFSVSLNPDHAVYQGHFPGNPVVPGVCQVQMIRELTSLVLKKDVMLSQADNIKFLSIIRPSDSPVIQVSLEIRERETDCWTINAAISREEQVFLKFKGQIVPE